MGIKHVAAEDFGVAVVDSSLHSLILAVFATPWCEPCQEMRADMEAIAEGTEGRLNIAIFDVEAEGLDEVMEKYEIASIPDMKVFDQRELVAQAKGVLTKEQIETLLAPYLRTEEQQRTMMLEQQVDLLLSVDQDDEALEMAVLHVQKFKEDDSAKIVLIGIYVKMGRYDLAKRLIKDLPSDLLDGEKAKQVIESISALEMPQTTQTS